MKSDDEYEKILNSRSYKIFSTIATPVLDRIDFEKSDWTAARWSFKAGEILFKIIGWIIVVGLFKLLYDRTQSLLAYGIYVVLNAIVFFVLFYSVASIKFLFVKPSSKIKIAINFLFNLFWFGIVYYLVNWSLSHLIAQINAIK